MAVTRWVQELMEPKKATYPLISESGAEYSWDGLSDDLEEALLVFMAVNYLAESSFRRCDFPTVVIWLNWNDKRYCY